MRWWRRADPAATDLQRVLARYFELQVVELERAAAAGAEAGRQREVRAAAGQLVTRLLLLVAYAIVLGLASRDRVVAALADPAQLGHSAELARSSAERALELLPDALRGLAVSTVSAGALLVLRGASFNVRSDVGGALFVGVAIVSLVGFSAAAGTGFLGVMAALPGFVAAAFVVYELTRSLRRMRGAGTASGGERLLARLDPTRRPWPAALFLCLPVACLAVIGGSAVTGGGPLFWPSRTAMFAFGGWCAWACAATPAAVRIPLWAAVPWTVLVGLQLADDPVAYIFLVAAAGLLLANVVLVLWDRLIPARSGLRWRRAPRPGRRQAGPGPARPPGSEPD